MANSDVWRGYFIIFALNDPTRSKYIATKKKN